MICSSNRWEGGGGGDFQKGWKLVNLVPRLFPLPGYVVHRFWVVTNSALVSMKTKYFPLYARLNKNKN